MITDLRKRTREGLLYTREPNILARLEALVELSQAQQLDLCQIDKRSHAEYVPSECLLYLVRAYRDLPADDHFERLFRVLVARVARALPQGAFVGRRESFGNDEIQERVVERFVSMLMEDRQAYNERLDFYETCFDAGIARLKITAQRELIRSERGKLSLDDDNSGQPIVEAKWSEVDPLSTLTLDLENPLFRIPFEAAIDKLPIVQQRIIQMLLMGFQIDSNNPTEMTISRALGRSGRTIQNLRDKAIETLQADLKDGETQ